MKSKYAKDDRYAVTLKPDLIDKIDAVAANTITLPDRPTMIRVLIRKGLEYFEKSKKNAGENL